MSPRIVAALVVTIPILILSVLVGGWAGVIFVGIFGAILIAIVLDERS